MRSLIDSKNTLPVHLKNKEPFGRLRYILFLSGFCFLTAACSSDSSSSVSPEPVVDGMSEGLSVNMCDVGAINLFSSNIQNGESNVFPGVTPYLEFSETIPSETVLAQAINITADQAIPRTSYLLDDTNTTVRISFDGPLPPNTEVTVSIDKSVLIGCTSLPRNPNNILDISFQTSDLNPVENTLACGRILGSDLEFDRNDSRIKASIESALISLPGTSIEAVSNERGEFCIGPVPIGKQIFSVDGVNSLNSQQVNGYYPRVLEEWRIAETGITNVGVVYLPLIPSNTLVPVSSDSTTSVTPAQVTIETFPQMTLANLTVPAGAVSALDGDPMLGIAAVDPERLPAPLPPELQFPLVITVQSSTGRPFDEPVGICLPNLEDPTTGDKLAAFEESGLWSFNHQKGNFEVVGKVRVSSDGESVCSVEGDGLLYPGWHAVSRQSFLDLVFPNPNTVNDPVFDACTSDTYQRLLDQDFSSEVLNGVADINGSIQQAGNSIFCLYCDTAFDEYQVRVELPENLDPNQILKSMLSDINGFIDHDTANSLSINPFPSITDSWNVELPDLFRLINEFSFRPPGDPNNPQLGDIITIDFGILFVDEILQSADNALFDLYPDSLRTAIANGIGRADVVLSRMDLDNPDNGYWVFTTLTTPENAFHPVSGSREFGFERNDDGTVTFYTRGVDSPFIFGAQYGATAQFTGWQSYVHSLANKLKDEFNANIVRFDNSTQYLDEPPNCATSSPAANKSQEEPRLDKQQSCNAYSYQIALTSGIVNSAGSLKAQRSAIYGIAEHGEQVPFFLPPDTIAEITYTDLATNRYGKSLALLSGSTGDQVNLSAHLQRAGDINGNGTSDVTELTGGVLAETNGLIYFHDGSSNIGTYDARSGLIRFIGNTNVALTDIAFSPSGDLFGVTENALYQINRLNADTEFVGELGVENTVALEFDPLGRLFAATRDGQLVMLDTETGLALVLGNLGFSAAGDLAISQTGTLYMSTPNDEIVSIDTNRLGSALTSTAEIVGATGVDRIFGLAFDSQGNLLGFSGSNVYLIDTNNASASLLANLQGIGVGQAFGAAAEQSVARTLACSSG